MILSAIQTKIVGIIIIGFIIVLGVLGIKYHNVTVAHSALQLQNTELVITNNSLIEKIVTAEANIKTAQEHNEKIQNTLTKSNQYDNMIQSILFSDDLSKECICEEPTITETIIVINDTKLSEVNSTVPIIQQKTTSVKGVTNATRSKGIMFVNDLYIK